MSSKILLANMCPLTHSDLRRIFEKLDMNEDGLVSLEELKWLLDKIGYEFSPDELECFVVGKKSLDLNEFLLFWESISSSKQNSNRRDDVESDLAKAFEVFDLDGDGFITSPELECVLKRLHLWDDQNGNNDCSAMICAFDTNSDGRLDFQEFKNMMLLTPSS